MLENIIQSKQDLNKIAKQLWQQQEFARIRKLAYDHLIPEEQVEDFIAGKRFLLADIDVEEKNYTRATAKLADEMWLASDGGFTDVIGTYLCRKCSDTAYELLVLQQYKTLHKCIDYVLGKAFSEAEKLYSRDGMKANNGVCLTKDSTTVFSWVDEYYALDDAREEAEKKEKAKAEFIKERERREKAKAECAKREAERKRLPQKSEMKAFPKSTKPTETQMSLFDIWGENKGIDQDNETLEGDASNEPDKNTEEVDHDV